MFEAIGQDTALIPNTRHLAVNYVCHYSFSILYLHWLVSDFSFLLGRTAWQLHLHIDQDLSSGRHKPTTNQGWKILFPDSMESKNGPQSPKELKGYKSAKMAHPKTKPIWEAQFDNKSIFTSVRSLVKVLNQEPAKLATNCQDQESSKCAHVCSAAPVVRPSSNKVRDWTPFTCWSFLETIYVKCYR